MTTAPSGLRSTTWFADSQSRTKTCICGGRWKDIALATPLTRRDAPGSLSPLHGARTGVGGTGPSCKLGKKIPHQRDALVQRGRRTFDSHAIGSGEADAPVL